MSATIVDFRKAFETMAKHNMTGLDTVQAMMSGDLPNANLCAHLGVYFEEAAAGRVVVACQYDFARHGNQMGIGHGGLAATMADFAAGLAAFSLLPKGFVIQTQKLSVEFGKPILGGVIHATGKKSVAPDRKKPETLVSSVSVVDDFGEIVCKGSSQVTVMPIRACLIAMDRA